ncbi:hypothetical protein GCM10028794_17910 [Silanimonas algicola]|jgi:hypothetical protein|uniref:YjfB family protein n=1 Tax=Silanimonas sp. TaxID=1929290 RepID=UPI0022C915E5|nr:YjfB family protein [Silanimonas sp.]MCZ8062845.1 YjfB family protein [Silanimonas sp.]MCZ8113609.1 YjfB family protein [Silanimonas sp.]
MDPISAAIVRSATALSQAQLNQQVSYAVLRKAMDAEASTAAMLLQAIPQPPPMNGTSGGLVDTYA